MLTQKELKRLLSYDPETGLFTWLKSRGTVAKGSIAGSIGSKGYVKIQISGKTYLAHRLVFLYLGLELPEDVDHINHNRIDNRLCNLRQVSRADNCRNRTNPNTQKVFGVCEIRDKYYQVVIGQDSKKIELGCFNDYFEAVCARKSAELKLNYHRNHG
jgi:hypothetical protein